MAAAGALPPHARFKIYFYQLTYSGYFAMFSRKGHRVAYLRHKISLMRVMEGSDREFKLVRMVNEGLEISNRVATLGYQHSFS